MVKIRFTWMILIICVKLERDSYSRMNALSRSKHHIISTLNVYTEDFFKHSTKNSSSFSYFLCFSCKLDVWDFKKNFFYHSNYANFLKEAHVIMKWLLNCSTKKKRPNKCRTKKNSSGSFKFAQKKISAFC